MPEEFANAASRRTFLISGLGACAAGAMTGPVWGEAAAIRYYKAVFDERFGDARAFAAGAKERGIAAAAIRGDITRLFFDDLDLRWRQGPVQLAGFTTPASFFCLDLLARDRGMRVRHCEAGPSVASALEVLDGALPRRDTSRQVGSSGDSALVFWTIAPVVHL